MLKRIFCIWGKVVCIWGKIEEKFIWDKTKMHFLAKFWGGPWKVEFQKLFVTYVALLSSYCLALGDNYVRPLANTRLSGHTYSTIERWTIFYCLMECSSNEGCASFNYNEVKQICELDGFAEISRSKLKSQTGWTFYKKEPKVINF